MGVVLDRMSPRNIYFSLGLGDNLRLFVMDALGVGDASRSGIGFRASHLCEPATDFDQPSRSAGCSRRDVVYGRGFPVFPFVVARVGAQVFKRSSGLWPGRSRPSTTIRPPFRCEQTHEKSIVVFADRESQSLNSRQAPHSHALI